MFCEEDTAIDVGQGIQVSDDNDPQTYELKHNCEIYETGLI